MVSINSLIACAIVLVVAIILNTKYKNSIGIIGFIGALLIGVFGLGMSVNAVYALWPAKVITQMILVTFFFGYAVRVGTITWFSRFLLYKFRKIPYLFPVAIYIMGLVLGSIGVAPPALIIMLSSITVSICYEAGINECFGIIIAHAGAMSGVGGPLTQVGILINGFVTQAAGEAAGSSVVLSVWKENMIVNAFIVIVAFFVFKAYKLKDSSFIKKPDPLTPNQRKCLIMILISVIILLVPGLISKYIYSGGIIAILTKLGDVGIVYGAMGIVSSFLFRKEVPERDIIRNEIPWNIIVTISGMFALLSVASNAGLTEIITNAANNIPTWMTLIAFSVLAGFLSLFSDSVGVVIPLFASIGAVVALSTGIPIGSIVAASSVAALAAGSSPTSTGGGLMMTFVKEERRNNVFLTMFVMALCLIVLTAVVSFTGMFK